MFSAIRYQWQIWQLNRELDRIDKRYRPTREAEKGAVANAAPWSSEEGQATYTVMNRISVLETADLLRRAAREKVPTPDNDDEEAWIEARAGGYYLTTSAYACLRAAIRQERNEKWDFRLKVFGLLGSTAIGTIGALIGLVAALKR
jgi:GH15 family glucan-1,4-alpha-glucosidase